MKRGGPIKRKKGFDRLAASQYQAKRRGKRARRKPKYPGWRLDRDRWAWKAEHVESGCWWCGKLWDLECHEITSRGTSPGRWAHRCNYAICCGECHSGVVIANGHVAALAMKYRMDREHFDLAEWIRIRGNGPEEVTMDEILAHV